MNKTNLTGHIQDLIFELLETRECSIKQAEKINKAFHQCDDTFPKDLKIRLQPLYPRMVLTNGFGIFYVLESLNCQGFYCVSEQYEKFVIEIQNIKRELKI